MNFRSFFHMFTSRKEFSVLGKGRNRFLQIETTFYDVNAYFDWKEEKELLEIRLESESEISFADVSFLFSSIQSYFEKKKQQVLLLFFDFEGDQFYITSSLHDKRENILKKLPLYCDGGKLCIHTASSFSLHFRGKEIWISYGELSHLISWNEKYFWFFPLRSETDVATLFSEIEDWENFLQDVNTVFFKKLCEKFPFFGSDPRYRLNYRYGSKLYESSDMPDKNIVFLTIMHGKNEIVQFQPEKIPNDIKFLPTTMRHLKMYFESSFLNFCVGVELFHYFLMEIKTFDTRAYATNAVLHSLFFLEMNYYSSFHVWKVNGIFQVSFRFNQYGDEQTEHMFSGETVEELYEQTKEYARKIYKSERLAQLFS